MTDQSDKPKLGTRPPLGLKRTVETGKVKQRFSYGARTRRGRGEKRRILARGRARRSYEPKARCAPPRPPALRRQWRPWRRSSVETSARRELQGIAREADEARCSPGEPPARGPHKIEQTRTRSAR